MTGAGGSIGSEISKQIVQFNLSQLIILDHSEYLLFTIYKKLEEIITKRVILDQLTNKGTEKSPLMYYESGLFNGVGFDVYPNGQLKYECNFINSFRWCNRSSFTVSAFISCTKYIWQLFSFF